ncbi:MAG: response regulator [Anaerolineaceae bacterium]|nr:response regulator [Anaerolineaceae bacterium]
MTEKILIVDDDPETIRLISMVLQRRGYQIIPAYSGEDAIKLALLESPNLVLLDIMMPKLDGYQVTRELRDNRQTANIPILMFSAKSQVDDRVAGYESGIDDYLTKPIHPTELVARVKSLISRSKTFGTPTIDQGYSIGVIAPKGGLGSSSFTLNLAINLYQESKKDVVAVELRPGHGSWGIELGFENMDGLSTLLQLPPSATKTSNLEKELVRTPYGVNLLLSSNSIENVKFFNNSDQLEAVVRVLPDLASIVLFDIGACFLPNITNILSMCDEILLIIEPHPTSIKIARKYLEVFQQQGLEKTKVITPIMLNRVRADIQTPLLEASEMLGRDIEHLISPVPELAYQAALNAKPLILMQPKGLINEQFLNLTEMILNRLHIEKSAQK